MTKFNVWNKRARQLCSTLLVGAAAFLCAASCADYACAVDAAQRWTRAPRSTFVGIVKETCKSVVSIQGEKQYENGRRNPADRNAQYDVFNGMGTGVIVDERGYILTNYHVVKGLLKLEVITSDGERYRDVELVRNDVATDLAILKIKPKQPLRKIDMGRVENVELAEDVFAIGNPYGYHCSITRGVVSSLDRPLEVNDTLSYERVIQTDAAINPGNSGGPLINVDGEMIGLNAAVREDAENIAFAIPVDVVSEVVERMLRQTVAKMTHHGLKFKVVGGEDPDYPSCGDGHDCLVVASVDAKSPAADAGVKPGDVLLSSNGYPMRSSLDFTCSLIGMGLSDSADLKYERNGSEHEAVVAFSGLAKDMTRDSAIASARKVNRYADAETSDSVADQAVEIADEDAPSPSAEINDPAQEVWNVFGVEVETISAQQYAKQYPNLQAVAIGAFNFAPNGGVRVVDVSSSGLFSSGDVKLQSGDLIFGFGVGNDKENQLSVASLDNLYYIAQKLDEFAAKGDGQAKVYLIRGGKPYFLEIDLNAAL